MRKLCLVLIANVMAANSNAQGVGVGTSTPKAAFNVAQNKTVLFGNDTSGSGGKLMWIPAKYAFRAGIIGPIPGDLSASGTLWDYDSIGLYSFAAGRQNIAKGNGSVAAGETNQALASYSVAMGYSNETRGQSSIGLGYGNLVSSAASIALGSFNIASGNNSNVIGSNNLTLGELSTAMGFGVINNSYASIVVGANNDTIAGANRYSWVDTDPLFVIGGGRYIGYGVNTMTMLKNGKTGLGTNVPLGQLHIKYNSAAASPTLMLEEEGNDYARINFKNANPGYWRMEGYSQQLFGPNDEAHFNFYFSLNNYILSLRGNGNAVLTGTLYQNSDEDLKKNILPITNSLSKLSKINGYTYQWKDTARGNEEQVGLLAQEVEKQFPQLVSTDEDGKKSVAYGNMVPVLLQAIKEQQQQIEELKKLVLSKLKQ